MGISVVIPTWNRGELLDRCLSTLKQYVEHDTVVIVEKERPTANARNIGVARCPDDDIIFSIDDDCYYSEEIALGDTLKAAHGHWGVIQTTRIMHKGLKKAPVKRLIPKIVCWLGSGLLFKKSTWTAVGGYPKDYLDDVMFSAVVYKAGYNNYRSTLSYGYHDVDTRHGGMFEVLRDFGSDAHYPCQPEKYFITGDPCISKGGIPNIKNITHTPTLVRLHNANARLRGFTEKQ